MKLKFLSEISLVKWRQLVTSLPGSSDWCATWPHQKLKTTLPIIFFFFFSRRHILESFKVTSCLYPKKLWEVLLTGPNIYLNNLGDSGVIKKLCSWQEVLGVRNEKVKKRKMKIFSMTPNVILNFENLFQISRYLHYCHCLFTKHLRSSFLILDHLNTDVTEKIIRAVVCRFTMVALVIMDWISLKFNFWITINYQN